MSEHAEKFNITLEEFFSLIADLLDLLYEDGLSEQNGTIMETVSVLLEAYNGDYIIESYCLGYEIWGDAYKKEFDFFLKDFGNLLGLNQAGDDGLNQAGDDGLNQAGDDGWDYAGYQKIAQIYAQKKEAGEECVVTEEDIDEIFDFLIALSRHACRYIMEKQSQDPEYLPHFPLEEYKTNFGL